MYTPPPSSLKPDYTSLLEWGVFLTLILLAIYCAWVVKNEKKSFKQDASYVDLGGVSLLIANWWAVKSKNLTRLVYHRADTRYDWEGIFEIQESSEAAKDAATRVLEERKLELDNSYESFSESSKAEYLFRDIQLREKISDFYRCEGIGTSNQSKRVYMDLVVFRFVNSEKLYVCSSMSSVLNGCVEGPYFEESLVNANLS